MKRGLLIGAGTLGSLGAVMAITPPTFGTSNSAGAALGAPTTGASSTTASTPTPAASTPTPTPSASTPTPTPSATKAAASATKKATPKASKKATPTPSATKTTPATPTPTPTKTSAPASSGASGTFTGATYQANEYGRIWGNVSVTVTLKNGVISSSVGSQNPSSRGYFAFNQIDPYVSGQKITIATIKSTAATALPYVSGATYSSIAYWESLKSALSKAGI